MRKLGHYTKAVSPGKVTTNTRQAPRKVSTKPPAGMKTSRLGKGRK